MNQPAKPAPITLQQISSRQPFQKLSRYLAIALFTLGTHAVSHAAVFTENFNAPFPNWEAGVFGSNTNARNYYCGGASGCANRGNNPDGLYVIDSSASTSINVSFNSLFGSSLTAFSLDVAAFNATALQAFDSNNLMIFNADVTLTAGAFHPAWRLCELRHQQRQRHQPFFLYWHIERQYLDRQSGFDNT